MTKKIANKQQLKGVIVSNILVQVVGLGLFGDVVDGVEVNTNPHSFDKTFAVLKLVIGVSLFAMFSAIAYGLASWAIDTGKMQAYALTILFIVFAIRSLTIGIKSWRAPAKANG